MVTSPKYQERFVQVEKILLIDKTAIDMTELRSACIHGIPDTLRPLAWRLLLNYLPTERDQWKTFLEIQRNNYDTMVDQLLSAGPSERNEDHPLSDHSGSEWSAFFEDNKILEQIDKDVRRLRPEMQFFQLNTPFPHKISSRISLSARVVTEQLKTQEFDIAANKQRESKSDEENSTEGEAHWEVVERILFVYAKLNPGVKYVQGMNEVLGPLYHVFAADRDVEWAAHAEADVFFCFQQLMSEIKDSFINSLDNSSCGIDATITSFHNLVAQVDPQLYAHILNLEIDPKFYAFRWFSLILSQEFPLPDVVTIWDGLFADSKRFTLLPYICLAMLQQQREVLLASDFATCMKLLQDYPAVDVSQLVTTALTSRDTKKKETKHKRTFSDKLRDLTSIIKR